MDAMGRIEEQLGGGGVVLYMKGTPDFPRCGFSAQAVRLLGECGAGYAHVDVLADPELREALKARSGWPTYPQLYVGGELVGGCDIMAGLHAEGRLAPLLAGARPRGG